MLCCAGDLDLCGTVGQLSARLSCAQWGSTPAFFYHPAWCCHSVLAPPVLTICPPPARCCHRRQEKRSDVDVTYLKNVLLQAFESGKRWPSALVHTALCRLPLLHG